MAIAYIALGSNLGNRKENIHKALELMEKCGISVCRVSSLFETRPVGGPPQDDFINAAAQISTELSPESLLEHLQTIENKLGRIRTVPNGPRTIDLDILLYDNTKMSSKELTIPHPRMLEREFVMTPLRQVLNADHYLLNENN